MGRIGPRTVGDLRAFLARLPSEMFVAYDDDKWGRCALGPMVIVEDEGAAVLVFEADDGEDIE
jgi:hypothetical protein